MAHKIKVNHWLRLVMDDATDRLVSSWDVANMDALEISGSAWNKGGFKSYRSVQYPNFDICVPFDEWSPQAKELLVESADIVFAEQVWEHLHYPYRAAQNVKRLLRPGGRFVLTTPFLLRVHGIEQYSDCSRWTPDGMKYFLEEVGFEIDKIYSDAWGNKECAAAHITNEMWFEYQDGMNLENDPIYPCVVWAVAQK